MAENNLSLMNELAECVTKNLEPLTRILEENNVADISLTDSPASHKEYAESILRNQELIANYFQEYSEDISKFQKKSKGIIAKIQDSIEAAEMTEYDIPWQEEVLESLTKNLDLFARYFRGEILAIRVTCELFVDMQISVRTGEDTWENAMAEDIPYEEIAEEDRDCYKDCRCGNECIWIEFCDACSEEEIKSIMDSVCGFLGRKYGVCADLVFREG